MTNHHEDTVRLYAGRKALRGRTEHAVNLDDVAFDTNAGYPEALRRPPPLPPEALAHEPRIRDLLGKKLSNLGRSIRIKTRRAWESTKPSRDRLASMFDARQEEVWMFVSACVVVAAATATLFTNIVRTPEVAPSCIEPTIVQKIEEPRKLDVTAWPEKWVWPLSAFVAATPVAADTTPQAIIPERVDPVSEDVTPPEPVAENPAPEEPAASETPEPTTRPEKVERERPVRAERPKAPARYNPCNNRHYARYHRHACR